MATIVAQGAAGRLWGVQPEKRRKAKVVEEKTCKETVEKKNIVGGGVFPGWREWTWRRRGRAMRAGMDACVTTKRVGMARGSGNENA